MSSEPLDQLAAEVATMAADVSADLLLVFDDGGVTGHPDHTRATAAALAGAPALPVLAWALPSHVALELNTEFGTGCVGRPDDQIDVLLSVDRARQRRAIARHASQSVDNPFLARRLALLGDTESLRWLRRHPPEPLRPSDGGEGEPPAPAHAELAERWDRRYASAERLFRAEPDESLVELVAPLPPGRAVDLGAGEGRNSLWLAARGWQVTAVDVSREALRRLADGAGSEGVDVTTVAEELTSYLAAARGRGESFDLVVLSYIHPDPDVRSALLRDVAAAVGAGGYLFVVAHHRLARGISGPFDPSRLYSEQDLREVDGDLDVLLLEQRHGHSDLAEPGTDVVLWARRPPVEVRSAS